MNKKNQTTEQTITHTYSILVAEDDKGLLHLIQKKIQQDGYHTEGVTNGADAIACIKRKPDILLLLDYNLPEMNGKEVIETLVEQGYNIPFVIITGFGDINIAVEMMKLGARDYIVKEHGFLDLLPQVLERVINQLETEQYIAKTARWLQESEEKYRITFEMTGTAMVIIEEDTTLTLVNSQFERLSGYSKKEIEGHKRWTDFVVPEDLQRMTEYPQRRRIDEKIAPAQYEFRSIDRSGKVKNILVNINMIPGTKQSIASLLDITERKRAEEALRTSEQQYRNLIEHSPDMIAVNCDGKLVYINAAGVKLFGADGPEDLVGKPVFDFIHPAYRDSSKERIRRIVEEGQQSPLVEQEFVRLDGTTFDVEVTTIPFTYQGKPAAQAIVRDITERKQAEKTLRESEMRYKSLYSMVRLMADNVPDLIWAKDLEHKFIFTNKAICEKLLNAKDTDEPIGKTDLYFADRERKSHPDYPNWHTFGEICKESDSVVMKTKRPERFDESGNVKGKHLFLDVYKAPFRDNLGNMIGTVGCGRDVTKEKIIEKEHHLAEEALKTSEEKYQDLYDNAPDMYFSLSPEGIVTSVNKFGAEYLGYTRDELIGNPVWNIAHKDDFARVKKHFLETFDRKIKKSELDFHKVRKDGSTLFVHERMQLIFNEDGIPTELRIVCRDITGRKRAQEEIRQLSTFPEKNPHPIFSTDLEGKIKYANPAAYLIIKEIGVKNKNVAWLLPRDRKQTIARLLKKKEVIATSEYHRKGHVFSSEIHIPKGGDIAHIYLTDITERVRQEEETKRLLTAVEQAAEGIIITNPKGAIQYVNPMLEKMTGYTKEEAIGKSIRNFKFDTLNDPDHKQLWKTIKAGHVWVGFLTNKKKDGSLYKEEVTVSPIRNSSDKILNYVFVGRDVTQEMALEEQLRQMQKLEAVGRLAGGIAHDFNNILTGIIGYADLALASLPKDHQLYDYFKTIIKKSDDAASLIRQLLAFSRKQILDLRQTDMNHVIRESTQFLKRVLRDDIKFRVKIHKSPCIFNADATAMQQILANLCVNAQDAMPKGGRINITTSTVTLDQEFCSSRPKMIPGQYVELTVRDTGAGIDAAIQDYIYEPFFTTKEVGVGTGLGLSTVYGLVKQHNGFIDCITSKNDGTTFVLFFPQINEGAAKPEEEATAKAIMGKETILIIEDDVDVLNILKKILDHSGYSTLIAKNGRDGLKILKKKSKNISLVITDIFMPNMTGIELYHQVKDLEIDILFLFITGHAPQELKSIVEPGMSLMQKPFTSNQITVKIRKLLDEKDRKN